MPRGSVRVTAGGRILVEGIDYLVDYQSGTVEITNPSLEASNMPIQVSVENNLIFGGQSTRFMGMNIEHKFSDKFIFGGSIVNLRERPFTQKTSYGQESVNNTIFGFGGTYSTEMPFLTRWVNRLPTIKSDAPSNLSVRGEFAYLIPGTPKGDSFDGETTVYLDDFESAQTTIDIRSPLAWKLASTPLEFGKNGRRGIQELFGTSPDDAQNMENGHGRAKLAWYTIDPIFYSAQKPSDVSLDEISKNSTRRIYIEEIFPEQQVAQGQSLVQPTLDLAYYPSAKGSYNNASNFSSKNADEKWGGIMRGMTYSDFQESNIEYIQFWMLDPYTSGEYSGSGELVFNLGNISEDVLKDGRKQYENGLRFHLLQASILPLGGKYLPPNRFCMLLTEAPKTETCKMWGLTGYLLRRKLPYITATLPNRPTTPRLIIMSTFWLGTEISKIAIIIIMERKETRPFR